MSSTMQKLMDKGLTPGAPPFLRTNVHYETITGSHAYGCADTSVRDKIPDYDIYGFGIPPRDMLFPQRAGKIVAFGEKPGTTIMFGEPMKGFEQWQKHGIIDEDATGGHGKEYDMTIYNIVKYFELLRQNNPNMLDTLYTPENCVLHCTHIGRMVRDARHLFLSKQCWWRFRGYAQEQLKKMNDKETVTEGKDLRSFENEHGIPNSTKLAQVEEEMKKRGLL